jgi:pimeloyl-ACP methyl ester carboxylesterase
MHVELVRTTTSDGLRLDGALAEHPPTSGAPSTAAILLHGVAGNFYTSSTFEPLVPKLQGLGLSVLSVNTRGHDSVFGSMAGNVRRRFGAAYEIVDECRLDIAAWIELLASRGHERVVLIGHSLGAIKAVYAQAHEKWSQVAAVVAVSPPRLSYAAFMSSDENSTFWESYSIAERMVAEGRGEELFTSKFPFPLLITANAYIDKYGPAERYNILRFAAEVPCPALFTYGSKELENGGIAFAGLPEALLSLGVSTQGRTVQTIGGADHAYTGVAGDLAEAITSWIEWRQREPLVLELRARARHGENITTSLRWLHDQAGSELRTLDLIRIVRQAFGLTIRDAKPIAGWSPKGDSELNDEALNALVQPRIEACRAHWDSAEN